MKNNEFCQSCGIPLTDEFFATNADQTVNEEYCKFCFNEGSFTSDVTMDEMIEHCLEYIDEFNKDSDHKFTKEEAREEMKKYFPLLKRWQV